MITGFEAWVLNFTQVHEVFRGFRGEEGIYNFSICFHWQFFSMFNILK